MEVRMVGKFALSVLVAFVLSLGLGYVFHGLLLAGDYAALPSLFRTPADQQAHFAYMLIAQAMTAIGFSWIYIKGREAKPFLAQGLRFGLAIAVLMTVPTLLVYYAVQPMPGLLVVKQIVCDVLTVFAMGVAVAWVNR
jgi:hypothetical protein